MEESATYYDSPIGRIKITADGSAVTSINFVEDGAPQAEVRTSPVLEQCAGQLREYFDGRRSAFTFPTAQQGTDFQQRAWRELAKIPYGATITYGEQAARLGNAKAMRAVGAANGKNNLSIAVPCHRVVGKSGALVGYAQGLWRKQWLLQHEKSTRQGKKITASGSK
ncbi:MAG: methylated-DNA--[protein]-cysteine S-methyltransferase [Prevotellaceae bacterium]|jgi:methylated-DNA-[protein]-cysteine S-methyltransferase|nr:methylated-DNA--[protein]-cysteine S-methyltransferase [Prevotellaceae bacterium]